MGPAAAAVGTFLAKAAVGAIVGKIVGKITGNDLIGAIAGGFVGSGFNIQNGMVSWSNPLSGLFGPEGVVAAGETTLNLGGAADVALDGGSLLVDNSSTLLDAGTESLFGGVTGNAASTGLGDILSGTTDLISGASSSGSGGMLSSVLSGNPASLAVNNAAGAGNVAATNALNNAAAGGLTGSSGGGLFSKALDVLNNNSGLAEAGFKALAGAMGPDEEELLKLKAKLEQDAQHPIDMDEVRRIYETLPKTTGFSPTLRTLPTSGYEPNYMKGGVTSVTTNYGKMLKNAGIRKDEEKG